MSTNRYRLIKTLKYGLAIVLLSVSSFSFATQAPLNVAKQANVMTWIGESNAKPSSNALLPSFSVYQQVSVFIEVSTPTWFAGGTHIDYIEVPDAIVRQNNQQATNYTVREHGQTWSKQRWEIPIYPQRTGQFVIPSVKVSVTLAGEARQKIKRVFHTGEMQFTARLPSGHLTNDEEWFAASEAKIEQNWQSSNTALHVGDSVTRKVTLTAQDTVSIMLPSLLASGSTDQYQSFSAPAQLTDQHGRGNYRAQRSEEQTYVLQQGGEVTFPAIELKWWDSKTQQLKTLLVPPQTFSVKHTLSSYLNAYRSELLLAGGLVLMLSVIVIGSYRYYQTHPKPEWALFLQLLWQRQWPLARVALYRALRHKRGLLTLNTLPLDADAQRASDAIQQSDANRASYITLWGKIRAKKTEAGSLIPKCLKL